MKFTIFLLFLFGSLTGISSPMQYVDQFYSDAYTHFKRVPIKYVEIVIHDIPGANGRIDRMPDGHLRIVIETEFYNYYGDSPQMKRLIYYLLAHELLGLNPGKGLMNPERVYYPIKQKHITRLFS